MLTSNHEHRTTTTPNDREGILFVISAPSGAGKTSLCRELIDSVSDLRQSVSFATRQKRPGEVEGIDYHFIDEPAFHNMVDRQQLAEWAEVHGNFYGTAVATLEAAAAEGIDLLLDIDCQGAAQLKQNYSRGVFIFILPPDLAVLEKRLRDRGTDNESDIRRRLKNAQDEINQAVWYDYLVVNDDFNSARETLKSIVAAERHRSGRNKNLLYAYSVKGEI